MFKIEALPDYEFEFDYISPIDLLALTTQLNLEEFKPTKLTYTFALEHIKVKVGEAWLPVKVADREVYMPSGIETNLIAISQLCNYFLNEVLAKAFTKSEE